MVTRHLLDHAGVKPDEGHGGAVTLIQRFGSAANLNVHLHCLVLDGVYRCGADCAPTFVEVSAPTDDELHALLQTIITRLMKMLTRRGALVEDMGQTYLAEPDPDGEEARTLRPLQAAAIAYRIAFGPRAGQKMVTLRGAMLREATARQPLCADIDGFSLHRRCDSKHMTASGWSNWAATSPGRRCPTSGFSSTPPARWNSSSKHRGATEPRTWS
ncbi:MAG TPA: transposase [Burkholderiaceae bacterium]